MVPFAIAMSAGILFLLWVLIAFWTETRRGRYSEVQIRSRLVRTVTPFTAVSRRSETLKLSAGFKDAAEATNAVDERTKFRYTSH